MDLPLGRHDLKRRIDATIEAAGERAAAVRLIITRGSGPHAKTGNYLAGVLARRSPRASAYLRDRHHWQLHGSVSRESWVSTGEESGMPRSGAP